MPASSPRAPVAAARSLAPQLRFRTKLLLSFAAVLVPLLVLMLLDSWRDRRASEEVAVEKAVKTTRGIAELVEGAFIETRRVAETVASTSLAQTMDPAILDPWLLSLQKELGGYDAINVFDENGVNRGWGNPVEAAEPRLDIAFRDYFKEAMRTNRPVYSNVIDLRRPNSLGMLVCVPIRSPEGKPIGVVNVVFRTDLLVDRFRALEILEPGENLLLADRTGRLAFHTRMPKLDWTSSLTFAQVPELRQALAGQFAFNTRHQSLLDDTERIITFVPTPTQRWVVGLSVPRDIALADARRQFTRHLLGFGALLILGLLLIAWHVRRLLGPLGQLEAHARVIGEGDFGRRVHLASGDELESLGAAFNEMAATLEQRQEELARAQAQLLRRERLAALGELAALVAHEVRNPVAVIFNALNALKRPEVDRAQLLQIIGEESERLDRIVSDMLEFARPGLPDLHPHDLLQVLDESARAALVSQPAIAFEVVIDSPCEVPLDARMMRQALINLVTNAAQAMPQGGRVRVVARREQRAGRDGVRIDVEDQGPGVPPGLAERMFEPFVTSKASGTGLGLALVKRVAEDHGGEVGFGNREEGGAVFTVWIPLEGPSISRAG